MLSCARPASSLPHNVVCGARGHRCRAQMSEHAPLDTAAQKDTWRATVHTKKPARSQSLKTYSRGTAAFPRADDNYIAAKTAAAAHPFALEHALRGRIDASNWRPHRRKTICLAATAYCIRFARFILQKQNPLSKCACHFKGARTPFKGKKTYFKGVKTCSEGAKRFILQSKTLSIKAENALSIKAKPALSFQAAPL